MKAEDVCGAERPPRKVLCQLKKGHDGSHRSIVFWEDEPIAKRPEDYEVLEASVDEFVGNRAGLLDLLVALAETVMRVPENPQFVFTCKLKEKETGKK